MCDDFFDDLIEDNGFEPDSGCEEDFADEHAFDDEEMMDVPSESDRLPEQEEQRCFDLEEVLIFGSMIYGNAYEEMLDDKKRKQLIKDDKKTEK